MNRKASMNQKYSLLISIVVLFSACQKVINVKLNSSASKYVIEGVITDQPGACSVSISMTKDFSSDNGFTGVSGATVTVENGGTVFPLTETGNGIYTTAAITGAPGKTYNMKAVVSGTTYAASSTMPQPVNLDSIYVTKEALSNKNFITVVYADPAGIPNYYRWVQYINGRKEKTVFVGSDEFTDGLTVKTQLDYNNDTNDPNRDIKTGDTIRIDMISLDSTVYQYWFGLAKDASGSGRSASPSNPVSNITGGCMGYFSAQAVRTRTIVARK